MVKTYGALHTLSAVILQSMDVWWFIRSLTTRGLLLEYLIKKQWKPQPRTYTHNCYLIFICIVSSCFIDFSSSIYKKLQTAPLLTCLVDWKNKFYIQVFENKKTGPQRFHQISNLAKTGPPVFEFGPSLFGENLAIRSPDRAPKESSSSSSSWELWPVSVSQELLDRYLHDD